MTDGGVDIYFYWIWYADNYVVIKIVSSVNSDTFMIF